MIPLLHLEALKLHGLMYFMIDARITLAPGGLSMRLYICTDVVTPLISAGQTLPDEGEIHGAENPRTLMRKVLSISMV